MADIGNQLGKASEDLTKQFTNMGSVVETFASGMQESMEKLAESMGCFVKRVDQPNQIQGAMEQAFASGKPAVVDVVTDIDGIAPAAWSP